MKLKNILGVAVAAVATVLMTSAVFAATSFTAGTPSAPEYDDEDEVYYTCVPIMAESSDYSTISALDIKVTSSYEYGYTKNKCINSKGNPVFNLSGTGQSYGVQLVGYMEGTSKLNPAKYSNICDVYFKCNGSDSPKAEDFVVSVNEVAYFVDNDHPAEKIASSEFATYVICDAIPEDVTGSEWEGKFIHKLRVDVKTAGTDTIIKSDYIKQYYVDDSGKCVFVLKLVPSSGQKQIVDVDFVAEYATSSSATEASESATVQSFKDVVVEALS